MTTSMNKIIHLAGGCFRGMEDEAILKMKMAVPNRLTALFITGRAANISDKKRIFDKITANTLPYGQNIHIV